VISGQRNALRLTSDTKGFVFLGSLKMPVIEYSFLKIEVDEEGYLVRFEDWNEKVACALAEGEGVLNQCPLTEERMNILRFMREYYKKFESFPLVPAVCKNVHQPKNCLSEQFLDPIQAWKIAGLPKPTTEVLAHIHLKR
jgi:TusE/DsrC/DsvC family sulfur relay protein